MTHGSGSNRRPHGCESVNDADSDRAAVRSIHAVAGPSLLSAGLYRPNLLISNLFFFDPPKVL
jgi:hypothetical protein